MRRVNRTKIATVGIAMVLASVVAPAPAASVGTGLNQWNWSGANVTIGPSSYSYSNMAGFVQAVVNSNGCSLVVDGSYGGATSWATAVFQNNIIGYNNGGVMTPPCSWPLKTLATPSLANGSSTWESSMATPPNTTGTTAGTPVPTTRD